MKIEKTVNKLTVKLTGRLDTTTAPQLEEELKNPVTEVSELVLDFSGLEYISSAGLRVLLWANKSMVNRDKTMVIKGVNDEVREVFAITGFAGILTVVDGDEC